MVFQIGNQLLEERVPVWPVVGGVHGVRVVEIRRRVLERHRDHAREIGGAPGPVELETRFPRRPGQSRRALLRGFGARVRRESERRAQVEVALLIHGRVAPGRVRLVSAREQDRGAQVDRPAPPGGENLALDLDVLLPLRVRRQVDGREDPGELETDRITLRRIEVHLPHRAHEVSRRLVELLAFPLVVVQPQGVAVRATKLRVHVEQSLHVVVARRNVLEARDRVPEGRPAHDSRCAGRELGDIDPEERRAVALVADL